MIGGLWDPLGGSWGNAILDPPAPLPHGSMPTPALFGAAKACHLPNLECTTVCHAVMGCAMALRRGVTMLGGSTCMCSVCGAVGWSGPAKTGPCDHPTLHTCSPWDGTIGWGMKPSPSRGVSHGIPWYTQAYQGYFMMHPPCGSALHVVHLVQGLGFRVVGLAFMV